VVGRSRSGPAASGNISGGREESCSGILYSILYGVAQATLRIRCAQPEKSVKSCAILKEVRIQRDQKKT
jgi:hypothetical protein